MNTIREFLKHYWSLIVGLAFVFWLVISCNNVLTSCTQNAGKIAEKIIVVDTSKTAEILLVKIETLEKNDSLYKEKIEEIDSLRIELGGTYEFDTVEQYRFLSSRYANPKAKR